MRWLRRDVHTLKPYYTLCTNEKMFRAVLKKLKIKEKVNFVRSASAGASTHFLYSKNNKNICIVTIKPLAKRSIEQRHAVLMHEALHVWQEHCGLIGEEKPSAEFEAYAVQLIAQELMLEYRNQVGRGRPRTTVTGSRKPKT